MGKTGLILGPDQSQRRNQDQNHRKMGNPNHDRTHGRKSLFLDQLRKRKLQSRVRNLRKNPKRNHGLLLKSDPFLQAEKDPVFPDRLQKGNHPLPQIENLEDLENLGQGREDVPAVPVGSLRAPVAEDHQVQGGADRRAGDFGHEVRYVADLLEDVFLEALEDEDDLEVVAAEEAEVLHATEKAESCLWEIFDLKQISGIYAIILIESVVWKTSMSQMQRAMALLRLKV